MLRVLLYPQEQRAFIPISANAGLQDQKSAFFSGNMTPSANSNWLAEGGAM